MGWLVPGAMVAMVVILAVTLTRLWSESFARHRPAAAKRKFRGAGFYVDRALAIRAFGVAWATPFLGRGPRNGVALLFQGTDFAVFSEARRACPGPHIFLDL